MLLHLFAASLLSAQDNGIAERWNEQFSCGQEHYSRGKLLLAERCFESALAIAETSLDSRNLGAVLSALSTVLLEQGRIAEAEGVAQRSVRILRQCAEEACGNALGRALRSLAILYAQQNRLSEAEQLLTEALAVHTRARAPAADVAQVLNTLGLLEMTRWRPGEAESYFRRGLFAIHEAETADLTRRDLYANLATALLVQHRNRAAMDAAQMAVESSGSVASPDYFRTVRHACALLAASSAPRDYDRADRSLDIARIALTKIGIAPRERALVFGAAANLRFTQKRFAESATFYSQAIEALAMHVSADHPDMQRARICYAVVLRKLNRTMEAEQVERELRNAVQRAPADPGAQHKVHLSDLKQNR